MDLKLLGISERRNVFPIYDTSGRVLETTPGTTTIQLELRLQDGERISVVVGEDVVSKIEKAYNLKPQEGTSRFERILKED